MAVKHVVRCDAEGCEREENLTVSASTQTLTGTGVMSYPGSSYSVPSHWRQIDGRAFCSWACVEVYAARQAREEPRRG